MRSLLKILAGLCAISVIAAAVAYYYTPDYSKSIAEQQSLCGSVVLDRTGRLLRVLPDPAGRYCLWRRIDEFPESLKITAIAAEDKRFPYHPGFDPIAVVRAVWTNLSSGRTVSGASTITQQVVRLIRPRPRTVRSKLIEFLCALKMELQLTKSQILELYLNLSPMGGMNKGAGVAALSYFGKDAGSINTAEAAVLAALPRSPSRFDPRRPAGRALVLAEKDRILARATKLGFVDPVILPALKANAVRFSTGSRQVLEAHGNKGQPRLYGTGLPFEAPHFVDYVMRQAPARGREVRTTLDLELNKAAEQVVRSHRRRLAQCGIEQAGVMIASVAGEVLAMVGSVSYGPGHGGFNNAVLAPRSAGSTLKPFLYAMALDRGYGSASEISDTFRSYRTPHGDYLPLNADRRHYGPVTVRSALGNSLNIAAIRVANDLGTGEFYGVLQQLGLATQVSKTPDYYGLGLAIGNMEVSLFQLVQAYAALAREGSWQPLQVTQGANSVAQRVFSTESAYLIQHMLSDPSARLLTFGNPPHFHFRFPVAVKTGTSTNYRDCWSLAYTSEHVVGVWAGNFDGRPSNGVTGSAASGPILYDLMERLYGDTRPREYQRPAGIEEQVVCSMSGKMPCPACTYTTTELVWKDRYLSAGPCKLPHNEKHHHYLAPVYAQWIDQRNLTQGSNRYRLMTPDPPAAVVGFGRTHSIPGGPGRGVEIVSPHNSDRFVMSPYRKHRILFRAVPSSVVREVVWLVDGSEVARTGPPYQFFWEPTRGAHEVHALTPNMEAAGVSIHVE